MEMLSVIGVGLIATALCLVLRQHRPEFALMVSLGAGIFILFALVDQLIPVVEQVQSMLVTVSMPAEYAAVLFKALGICFITQIACDTCKDAGESAISSKIEMAGKLAVLAVSLPLFQQVLAVVRELMA